MDSADSIARLDLLALGCLIGAGLIGVALLALLIAEGLPRLLPRRKDRP